MNEPKAVPGPRWFMRPLVWLGGFGVLLMLVGIAAWWGSTIGVRAMQAAGAYPHFGAYDPFFGVEESFSIDPRTWLWDANVTVVSTDVGSTGFNDTTLLQLQRFPNLETSGPHGGVCDRCRD